MQTIMDAPPAGRRFLGLNLADGVLRRHVAQFLVANFALIMLASFLPQMQAYLLSEFVHAPMEEHGRISGMLNFWQEIVIIAVVAVAGPLSDQWGRKPVIAAGFFIMALALALLPQTSSVAQVLACRVVVGVGIACVTVIVVTLLADYIANDSRGKGAGWQGVMNGFGAMVAVFLLLKLPALFQKGGLDPIAAGTRTYYIAAALSAVFGVMMALGLKGGRPKAAAEAHQSFTELARAGFAAARDPHIALAYAASFIARGNLAIVGTFLALWATNYGTTAVGLDRAAALAKAGGLVGMAQGIALLAAPLFGLLADRVDRVKALAIALLTSGIGYGSTFFVDNPFGGLMIFCAIFIGLGEVGCIITSGVLISQQSPEAQRGAVIGTFNLAGAVGILVASAAGGWLFDHWREPGPFVAYGVLALIVMAVAARMAVGGGAVTVPADPRTSPAS